MRIEVVALGSRGDVEPLLALASGLADADHEVCLSLSRDQVGLATARGLTHRVIDVDVAAAMAHEDGLAWQSEGSRRGISGELRLIRGLVQRFAEPIADAVLAIPAQTDLIISGALTYDAVKALVATRPTVRHVMALLAPLSPAAEGSSNALAVLPHRSSRINEAVSALTYLSVRHTYSRPGALTRERLGLTRESVRDYYRTAYATPTLLAASPLLVPPSQRWGPRVRQTGAWRLGVPSGYQPPQELVDFLQAGEAPVYLGFGSMTGRHPVATTDRMVQALEASGLRGIIGAGWSGLGAAHLPGTVHVVRDIPHAWLFPRTAAVVHHGGAGTTAAAAHAGVPQVVVPHIGDQPYWARRMHELGVASTPLPQHEFAADQLLERLLHVTSDGRVRERAARLGERLNESDGVAEAVALIGRWRTG